MAPVRLHAPQAGSSGESRRGLHTGNLELLPSTPGIIEDQQANGEGVFDGGDVLLHCCKSVMW